MIEIEGIMADHKVRTSLVALERRTLTRFSAQAHPDHRVAQKVLAAEATELIHGGE